MVDTQRDPDRPGEPGEPDRPGEAGERDAPRRAADGGRGGRNADRLRVRAAWMYYIEQRTQSDIAELLGVGRVTVVRMLADARARNEVRISVVGELEELVRLERGLEHAFGLDAATVVPLSEPAADPVPAIAAALGRLISATVRSGMRLGVGWGRTLYSSLPWIEGQTLHDFKVISLLGGIIEARRFNPAEFAWQLAERFQGEGYLVPAPAIVDSMTTRDALIDRCGIDAIFRMSDGLDAVLLSVGGMETATTTFRVGYLSREERLSLVRAGAVGDLLFHFFAGDGTVVEHDINERIVAVGIERLRRVPVRIMASGGAEKVDALFGAMSLVPPTRLVTDEHTARALLARCSG